MKIKPFSRAGGYTIFDNAILDYIMPECSPYTWKVLCAVIRKTVGWQDGQDPNARKVEDEISISQFMVLIGSPSRGTTQRAVQDAMDTGYLQKRKVGRSYRYRLNREYELDLPDFETVENGGQTDRTENRNDSIPKIGTIDEEIVPESGNTKQSNKQKEKNAAAGGRKKSLASELGLSRQQQNQMRGQIEDYFSELTRIRKPNPTTNRARGAAATRWWTPIRAMLDEVRWDVEKCEVIIRMAVERLDGECTISAPQSVEQTAIAIAGELRRQTSDPVSREVKERGYKPA